MLDFKELLEAAARVNAIKEDFDAVAFARSQTLRFPAAELERALEPNMSKAMATRGISMDVLLERAGDVICSHMLLIQTDTERRLIRIVSDAEGLIDPLQVRYSDLQVAVERMIGTDSRFVLNREQEELFRSGAGEHFVSRLIHETAMKILATIGSPDLNEECEAWRMARILTNAQHSLSQATGNQASVSADEEKARVQMENLVSWYKEKRGIIIEKLRQLMGAPKFS
ncbi:MAG: hypothetical protein PHO20_00155 [Candidatus Peribacteraceae bacterium]|nr:hypothetical protein [Candidatus Peribacteraceae bacterium]MDD5739169.1 hypothetical protein [Candidatus Peribacteraceae bacterium]